MMLFLINNLVPTGLLLKIANLTITDNGSNINVFILILVLSSGIEITEFII